MLLVYSQQARQILDLMIGFTISPLLWKKYDLGFTQLNPYFMTSSDNQKITILDDAFTNYLFIDFSSIIQDDLSIEKCAYNKNYGYFLWCCASN